MTDSLSLFKALRRPNLLIKAARIGVETYRRDRDLKRVLRIERVPRVGSGFETLLMLEEQLESGRQAGDTTYSITKHVETLTALIAEASLMPRQSNAVR